jgi:predicted PhzF superfamily epimerase YddE/YHI9
LPPLRQFVVRQGDDLGRPSRLEVGVPGDPSEGIRVSGTATRID